MQEHLYKNMLYFISVLILATLAMQLYWNYKNYAAGKLQVIRDVETSLDNAVDAYYSNLAKKKMIGFSLSDEAIDMDKEDLDILLNNLHNDTVNPKTHQSFHLNLGNQDSLETISVFASDGNAYRSSDTLYDEISVSEGVAKALANKEGRTDSLRLNPLAQLTSRVIYALTEDTIDAKKLDSLLVVELTHKNIAIEHQLVVVNLMAFEAEEITEIPKSFSKDREILSTASKSNYLPKSLAVDLNYSNVTGTIIRRNSIGLLLSLLFSIAIIACLLYLLKIIKSQKQLAEIKNDLISNITHEFKTPLATIGAAMEGIQNFNNANDIDKTLKYANISSKQVVKLNGMVEKILETATLDSENLELHKEPVDLVTFITNIIDKEAFKNSKKNILFTTTENKCQCSIDAFHFENAINNIIDNAIKYGGNEIEVTLASQNKNIEIRIKDSGNSLTENHKKQIFEKFYRVPKGNTHDVKGFGIGLYYSKAIIEKHSGTIDVMIKPTTFKICLPHA